MMNAMVESVRSLWLPLQGTSVLVPSVAVAEVIAQQPLEVLQSVPDWCLGALRWRGLRIPAVSIDSMCGEGSMRGQRTPHLAIMNSTSAGSSVGYFAVAMTGIPRLIVADSGTLGEALDMADESDPVACRVHMVDVEAVIPNLPLIQKRIEAMWQGVD